MSSPETKASKLSSGLCWSKSKGTACRAPSVETVWSNLPFQMKVWAGAVEIKAQAGVAAAAWANARERKRFLEVEIKGGRGLVCLFGGQNFGHHTQIRPPAYRMEGGGGGVESER